MCSKLNGTVQKGDMQECVESESIQCEMWECHSECKPLSDSVIDTILSFRAAFDLSVEEARQALAKCDYGCPYGHYTKYRLYSESVEIRDLESRGPWAVAAERSEDATKGLRLSKSRISIGRAV